MTNRLAQAPPNGSRTYNSLGEQLKAIANGNVLMQQGANETVASEGGYAVGVDFAADLTVGVLQAGRILPLVTHIPVGADANTMKIRVIDEKSMADDKRSGGIIARWEEEGAPLADGMLRLRVATLPLYKLATVTFATEELIDDAAALGAIIGNAYVNEMQVVLERDIVRGNGVGKPQGVLNSNAKRIVTRVGAPLNVVDIGSMWDLLHPNSYDNAVWLADPTLAKTISGMGEIADYRNGGQQLMGRPIVWTQFTNTAGTSGDIVLWDPTTYWLASKNVKGTSSMHVAFTTGEWAFKWTWRLNGQTIVNSSLNFREDLSMSPAIVLS